MCILWGGWDREGTEYRIIHTHKCNYKCMYVHTAQVHANSHTNTHVRAHTCTHTYQKPKIHKSTTHTDAFTITQTHMYISTITDIHILTHAHTLATGRSRTRTDAAPTTSIGTASEETAPPRISTARAMAKRATIPAKNRVEVWSRVRVSGCAIVSFLTGEDARAFVGEG